MIADSAPPGLALRISVTDRCQLRCRYCMPPGGRPLGERKDVLAYEEIASLARFLRDEFGLAKIRLTGGEPLVRPDLERLVAMLAELGVPDLAMTTNGLRLADKAAALKRAGLKRVNVSLDTLSPVAFRQLTGSGDVQRVLDGIAAARAAGLSPIKLNSVVIRGFNDTQLKTLLTFAMQAGCEQRFIELMPIGPGASLHRQGAVSTADMRQRLAEHFTLTPLAHKPGVSATRYAVVNAAGLSGTVGFISSCTAPFCGECTRLRVTATGRLIGCLARDGGIPVRGMLRHRDMRGIADAVRQAMGCKRTDQAFAQAMDMASIGG